MAHGLGLLAAQPQSRQDLAASEERGGIEHVEHAQRRRRARSPRRDGANQTQPAATVVRRRRRGVRRRGEQRAQRPLRALAFVLVSAFGRLGPPLLLTPLLLTPSAMLPSLLLTPSIMLPSLLVTPSAWAHLRAVVEGASEAEAGHACGETLVGSAGGEWRLQRRGTNLVQEAGRKGLGVRQRGAAAAGGARRRWRVLRRWRQQHGRRRGRCLRCRTRLVAQSAR